MKISGKFFAAAFLLAGTAIPGLARAEITLDGTVPVGRAGITIIQPNNELGSTGVVEFKFSAPGTGNGYALNFCIGPAANPCGTANAYVVTVPEGQSRLAIVNARLFERNELVVGQGTSVPVPFSVQMQ
jgi:hypothetical protein